jgi:hypothetical protein
MHYFSSKLLWSLTERNLEYKFLAGLFAIWIIPPTSFHYSSILQEKKKIALTTYILLWKLKNDLASDSNISKISFD